MPIAARLFRGRRHVDVVRFEAPAVRRALIGRRGLPASTCLAETVLRGHHDAHPHVGGLLADPSLPHRAHGHGSWRDRMDGERAAADRAGLGTPA